MIGYIFWLLPFVPLTTEADLHRFPGQLEAIRETTCARDFYDRMLDRHVLFPHREELLSVLEEANRVYGCWKSLQDAHNCEPQQTWSRRYYLRQLRERLGEQRYWEGRMPYPVPYWRFARVD